MRRLRRGRRLRRALWRSGRRSRRTSRGCRRLRCRAGRPVQDAVQRRADVRRCTCPRRRPSRPLHAALTAFLLLSSAATSASEIRSAVRVRRRPGASSTARGCSDRRVSRRWWWRRCSRRPCRRAWGDEVAAPSVPTSARRVAGRRSWWFPPGLVDGGSPVGLRCDGEPPLGVWGCGGGGRCCGCRRRVRRRSVGRCAVAQQCEHRCPPVGESWAAVPSAPPP